MERKLMKIKQKKKKMRVLIGKIITLMMKMLKVVIITKIKIKKIKMRIKM